MIDAPGKHRAKPTTAFSRAIGGAFVVLLASLLVGMAYNQLSPLGIRTAHANETARVPEPPITRFEGSPYGNQTLALAWIDSSGVSLSAPAPMVSSNAPLPHVTWLELKPEVERGAVTLLDARMPFQFQAGHIPGALSLPVTAKEVELDAFAASVSRARPIVVYCSNADCPMADRLGRMLISRYAYRNVRVLQGGYVAFRQAGARPAAVAPNVRGAEGEDL